MATTSKEVKIQVADEVIILTGAELEAFEADRAAIVAYDETLKAEKANAKAAILERLGVTPEDMAILLS